MTLTLAFGVLIGLALGLTGGGGSLIAIPLLVYGLGIAPHNAIGISLATVGLTAAFGALLAWRRGTLELRSALVFAAGGVVGAPLGTYLGKQFSPETLLIGFAVLALIVGVMMWRRANKLMARAQVITEDDSGDRDPMCRLQESKLTLNSKCTTVLVSTGMLTGVLTGLFGVGGGFIIVPALVLIVQLDIRRAVANSLLVISLMSVAGIFGLLSQGWLPPPSSVWLVMGSLAGLLLGTLAAKKIPSAVLQKAFAVIVVLVGLTLLLLQLR